MTTDEIIAAQEAFIKRKFWNHEVMWDCWKDAWDAGVAAERERCALVCESLWKNVDITTIKNLFSHGCAASAATIRKGE